MKIKSILLIIGLMVVGMTYAQPQRGQANSEERVKKQTEQMVKDLGLDEAQTVKVTALNKSYSEKMGVIFSEAGDKREGMREKMTALQVEKNKELQLILTEEQYTKYIADEAKRLEERKNNRANRPEGSENSKRGKSRN